jgi:hypothetical protein
MTYPLHVAWNVVGRPSSTSISRRGSSSREIPIQLPCHHPSCCRSSTRTRTHPGGAGGAAGLRKGTECAIASAAIAIRPRGGEALPLLGCSCHLCFRCLLLGLGQLLLLPLCTTTCSSCRLLLLLLLLLLLRLVLLLKLPVRLLDALVASQDALVEDAPVPFRLDPSLLPYPHVLLLLLHPLQITLHLLLIETKRKKSKGKERNTAPLCVRPSYRR